MSISRRKFLGTGAAAVIVAGTMAKGKVFGANDRVACATMGINGQGGAHLKDLIKVDGAEVVALCDVDTKVLEERAGQVEGAQKSKPRTFRDIRDLLEDESIDVLTIATPNHWHSLATVWGCMAGKDVYVEKPMSHTYWEGVQAVAAAKKYGRVVQHGTQSRSDPDIMRAMKLIHEGFIGDVYLSRGTVYKNGNRYAIGHGHPADPPAHIDYDLWLGPAPQQDYLAKEDGSGLFIHYNWHWFWDFGNGEIGNQGVHEMDLAVWGMNKGLPSKVHSTGGRYKWDDDGQTPNTQATVFTYDDGTMLEFEVRNIGSFHEADAGSCTNIVFGTEGYWVRTKGFFDYKNKPIEVTDAPPESAGRFGNFIDAVRSRQPEDNRAPAEAAQFSCAHIHLGNIAYRLGHSLEFDPEKEQFTGEGSREANGMLKRDYRKPFVVPEIA